MTARFAIAIAAAVACWAQPARLRDAQLQTRSVAGGLDATVSAIMAEQSAPVWIGWAAPLVEGEHSVCWGEQDGAVRKAMNLNPPRTLHVFVRLDQHQVAKIRPATPDCEIDANGATLYWLNGVRPEQSVDFLAKLANVENTRDGAVAAIALHAGAFADAMLEKLTAAPQPDSLRRKALFWMGNARGHRGYEVLLRILRGDPSEKMREQAIFALSRSSEPGAVESLIDAARNDRSARVRGRALFWLAQTAAKKVAADAITRAIDSDPETEVKKQAVFALSQLPGDEGVPKLILIARTHRNPEVRKQAMFWLGQSKDPRALDFFEQILTH
jgi:HEAT repeat protein